MPFLRPGDAGDLHFLLTRLPDGKVGVRLLEEGDPILRGVAHCPAASGPRDEPQGVAVLGGLGEGEHTVQFSNYFCINCGMAKKSFSLFLQMVWAEELFF